MKTLIRFVLAATLWASSTVPAYAAVIITFWSHELGNSFPHAFFTLHGTPDSGGVAVDATFGFTAKTLSPAILFGPVAGKIDVAHRSYVSSSDAQFSVAMTDAQYREVLGLVDAWGEGKPDGVYRLGDHNCVTFVKEAARRVGLNGLDKPGLMKKPRSYLKAIQAENPGRVTVIGMHGKAWLDKFSGGASASQRLTTRSVTRPGADVNLLSTPIAPK